MGVGIQINNGVLMSTLGSQMSNGVGYEDVDHNEHGMKMRLWASDDQEATTTTFTCEGIAMNSGR